MVGLADQRSTLVPVDPPHFLTPSETLQPPAAQFPQTPVCDLDFIRSDRCRNGEVLMGHISRDVLQWVDHLSAQQWLMALGAAIVVGLVCMRGYGSRSGY